MYMYIVEGRGVVEKVYRFKYIYTYIHHNMSSLSHMVCEFGSDSSCVRICH